MREQVMIPVKIVNGERWGDLASISRSHEICGEKVDQRKDLSFAGQHRVRLYKFTKNVHWRLPDGVEIDISDVRPAAPPRRGRR